MVYTANEQILPISIEDEMKDSYISYAMSVIVGRALPDIRDGLKPVHRRILYAMDELGLQHNKPYKKTARIVGEVLGKYHPHGDMAVYDALVRMVQDFSLRYMMIDGQGNFGSLDGDAAAAMRYTEARLHSLSEEMLLDLDKDTVRWLPNFDESLTEPAVLPAKAPNLLINGSTGIAVGMATNIPPHNLGEIADAVALLIQEPHATIEQLMEVVAGPDFPTGGIICGRNGIASAYRSGRGQIRVIARASVEQQPNSREAIVITEIPYQINKANLIESIAKLVQAKRVEGISDLRDESDRDGLRIVIDLKRDANSEVILNQLNKHTQMQTTFGINMLALVNGQPQVVNLRQALHHFIEHRKNMVVRRTRFELRKAEARAHVLEGLKIALANLDKVIKAIRASKSTAAAKERLMKDFELSDRQAQAILEMQLQRLTALEREKIDAEYLELIKRIEHLQSILTSERKVLEIIRDETQDLKKRFGDERRTEIIDALADVDIEDLIVEEDMVITISQSGYIKRIPVSAYRKQRRGGVGVTGATTKQEDFIQHLFVASTHEYLLFFTNQGKAYWKKVHEIPQAARYAKGKAVVNLLELKDGELVTATVPVREFNENEFLFMTTRSGMVKKTPLTAYSRPRRGGIIGIGLKTGDELIDVERTDGHQEILLATRNGKAIRFREQQVRVMGRSAKGVRGIRLVGKDIVVGMEVAKKGTAILAVTEGGYGKRTEFEQYRQQSRGGKGVINLKVTKKTKQVIGVESVVPDDELMLITVNGMVVRCPVGEIRATGRSAQGVRIMRVRDNDRVSAIALVPRDERQPEAEAQSVGPLFDKDGAPGGAAAAKSSAQTAGKKVTKAPSRRSTRQAKKTATQKSSKKVSKKSSKKATKKTAPKASRKTTSSKRPKRSTAKKAARKRR